MPHPSVRAASVQLPIIPQIADWIRAHPGTLSLGQGVAGYPPPAEVKAEIARLDTDPLLHRYQSVDGWPELSELLTAKLRRQNGITLDESSALMVTAGANSAFLQVILAVCDPGDEVILPLPYYFNQEMALALASIRPVLVPTDSQYHPDPDAIARAITPRTRAVVTISPNNPTGAVYPPDLLKAINELCERRGLIHISDETYEDFVYEDRHYSPGSAVGSGRHTVSLFSFSKAYGLASWRVGYAVYPRELRESLRKIQDTNLICPPVISQLAAIGCLRAGEAWVEARVRELSQVRERIRSGLSSLSETIEVARAAGAFYLLLRLPGELDSLEVARCLIEEHRVAVIPGCAFGVVHPCLLRVAFGALTEDSATEGIRRLEEGIRALASRL